MLSSLRAMGARSKWGTVEYPASTSRPRGRRTSSAGAIASGAPEHSITKGLGSTSPNRRDGLVAERCCGLTSAFLGLDDHELVSVTP